ncbi:Lcl3p [Sporobolomyces salmoneus]|uniref:Lcl3p n=1 Tax=Sporobolomyces salmoneus TaxID=183962 RepID=UPI00316C19B1
MLDRLFSSSTTSSDPPATLTAPLSRRTSTEKAPEYRSTLLTLSPSNPLLVGLTTTVFLTSTYFGYLRFGKRIRNVDELVLSSKTKKLRGFVTSVGDADNFRVWHRPLLRRFEKIPTKRTELKGETIHVRLAGVDAPEMAHFGKPAQPYSSEAYDFLSSLVLHKPVLVELFETDRYKRVVGMCYVRRKKFPWLVRGRWVNVSEEMLREGLATVYKQAGAVHDGKLKEFEQLERKAKAKKMGMWAMNSKEYESPAEYKKRTLAANNSD